MRRLTVLFYEYVEGMLEKRGPHRDRHLALIEQWTASGRLVLAGAFGDPPQGALLAFDVGDPAELEEFLGADPYMQAGLVAGHRIEPLNVVAHRPLD